ncbi:uncharacterized protein LY79DRAFT_661478 [Colletotrichum navitas]|uniref:Uncharacterized protein n=1 Tax=Colletotrichum navitas TaxID=681940 RepID=A0AAD8V2V4_9PEZI|nr:uncharacterized protein LY79DRAFT_661478 [Colletotrichum navitas]KAK1580088.1 hypothetical protein LY79DRAFT_661478 [Colletotrichum navitas]
MDQNQDNEGQNNGNNGGINGGNVGGNKVAKKKKRSRKGRDCCNCRKGYYVAAGALTEGIEEAITSCPPNNQALLGQLRILQRINTLRPDGGDLTRRTQAAILNDLTEVHEPMPSDEAIISLGDRCHNHLWYSALIRRNMVIPAEWQRKPHIVVRLRKLRAVWDAVKNTPNLRKRSAGTQVAANQSTVNQPAGDEDGEDEEDEDDEDDENDLDEGLQQPQNQSTYPTTVPCVNRPQSMAMNALAGYAINGMGQGYGQMHPDIAYGYQDQTIFSSNPTTQIGNVGLQDPVRHGHSDGLGQNGLNRQMQPLNQQLRARGPDYLPQQFTNPNFLSNNYGSFNNFALGQSQLPGSRNAAYRGFDGASLGPAGGIPSGAYASYAFQHAMPDMNNANHPLDLVDSNYMGPMLHGNFPRWRSPFSHSNQTSFQTRPDALGYIGDSTHVSHGVVGETVWNRVVASAFGSQLNTEPAALSGNGMTNAADMETGSGGNSESSTDGTDDDANTADAPAPSGCDGSQDDESYDDPSADISESEEEF